MQYVASQSIVLRYRVQYFIITLILGPSFRIGNVPIGIRIRSSKNVMLREEQEKEEIVVWGLPMGQEAGLVISGEEARER